LCDLASDQSSIPTRYDFFSDLGAIRLRAPPRGGRQVKDEVSDMKSPDTGALVSTAERDALQKSLTRLDRLAHLMDEQFRVPIVGWRVGLDPLIGIIPGGGDWASWVVGVYIFWEALRMDIPKPVLVRMVSNLTVDLVGGYLPGLGDIFDAAFKANRKNVDMILEHYRVRRSDTQIKLPTHLPAPAPKKSAGAIFARYTLGIVAIIFLFAIAALPFFLLWWWLNAG